MEFYDIQNGLFNAFTPKDLTSLNQEAIKHIREKIPKSGLMDTARREALEAILLIEKLVETIGWKLDYTALELSPEEKEKLSL
jgi:predicted type IV restriction endonuclease